MNDEQRRINEIRDDAERRLRIRAERIAELERDLLEALGALRGLVNDFEYMVRIGQREPNPAYLRAEIVLNDLAAKAESTN